MDERIGVHRRLCASEPFVAVLPGMHPLAKRKRLSCAELPDEPILMLHETHCLSRQIERWCVRHQIRPRAALPGTVVRQTPGGALAPKPVPSSQA